MLHPSTLMSALLLEVPLQFRQLPPSWVIALVLFPALVALAFLAYRKPARPRPRRRVLAVLRLLVLSLALFLAFGPFLRRDETRVEPAPLAILYDDSASLQRVDAPQAQRLEVLREIARSAERKALDERYRLSAYRVAEKLTPTTADAEAIRGRGTVSALGDALFSFLAEHRGRRIPEVILVSDGRVTGGRDLEAAAERFAQEGVRVHAIALGDPRPAPDLSLERLKVPDLVLVGDTAVFTLRLRGNVEQLPGPILVRLHDENQREIDRVLIETWSPDGVQLTLSTEISEVGVRTFYAQVEALPGEIALDNNRVELDLEARPARIRVLYVDGDPRWEYRYLKNRLLRSENVNDREIELRCWLASASRDFPQEASPGLTRLRRCPVDADELLENFDLVILGDVDPTHIHPDPLDGPRFLDAVATFVRRGGGLLMLAGPRHNPTAYRGTPLEPLLPVQLGRSAPLVEDGFRAMPSVLDAPHPVVMLDRDPQRNRAEWENAVPLWWFQPVERLRPGAQAWLVHPQRSNQHGPLVLAASVYAPDGWVGWIGTDETWRWRFPGGERTLQRFWRSALRHLASTRLRGAEGRARLDLDRSQVELGQTLMVEARLRDDSYQPLQRDEGLEAFLEDGPVVPLAPVPGQPGTYRGRFRAAQVGPGQIYLTSDDRADGDVLASARFHTVLPSREMRVTAQDTDALRLLTERTGGMLVQAPAAKKLLGQLDGSERLTRLVASHDAALDGRLLLALFLLLAATEWFLRKRSNLS